MESNYNPAIHHRRSIRLKEFNYSQNGYYFITICTKNRECYLGKIINKKMTLSNEGKIVLQYWNELPNHFSNVGLDEYVIMPNHLHGIIVIENDLNNDNRNAQCRGGVTPPLQHYTLGQIIAYLKYQTTKTINQFYKTPGKPFWQRNYYEHIIRNESELTRIHEYIRNNPIQWEFDRNNRKNIARINNHNI
ncbi:MAG: hypothetical protein A3B68_09050 [Candidatus Melainabacteria bacterium RIFCSPHIGHO2_02_FULL_34_12]|nr:MAG: hypothetical protein A3B68_09050 [Candidatus Melainabacteria bacterium RIFCSPHIGHO2_02_FULL_34_12]